MATGLDRELLLRRLDPVVYEPDKKRQDAQLNQMDIGEALQLLAELKHEREWELCRSVAKHLLGEVPEPDDGDLLED